MKREPLAIGTRYGAARVVAVVESDPSDAYQPYLYELDSGEHVWIPVTSEVYGYARASHTTEPKKEER